MIPSVSLHLLTQDNSIPGNSKDGFRYHHLLFVIVLTPIYLWFELAFGVRLLDAMSAHVLIDDTRAIGHSGRLISGAAVALFLLAGWFRECEKQDLPLGKAIGVSLGIIVASFFAAWEIQGMVLDFYVKRSNAELPWAFGALGLLVGGSFLLFRLWLRKMANIARLRYFWLGAGVVALLAIAYGQNTLLRKVDQGRESRLGIERQRTATLTIIRRGLQEGLVTLPGGDHPSHALASPEGKAYLALFPIFGSIYDQEALAADRPRLIAEFMYRDWDEQYGEQAYAGYKSVDDELERFYTEKYQGSSVALRLGDRQIAPRLDPAGFRQAPVVTRYLRMQLACFDCDFVMGMSREAFGRELFKWTKSHSVADAVETFNTAEKFETGRYGDRAARTYWAPILALLFSMLGVFVHVFRLVVTIAAYRHRLTFHRVGAADSPLAKEVLRNSTRVTAGAVAAMVLFTFFSDNRITGDPGYIERRPIMWHLHPIVGGIAAHWTVNAQGFIYPFTKKISPSWLRFDADPIQYIPIVRNWFADEEYE